MDGEQLVTVGVDTRTDVHVAAVLEPGRAAAGNSQLPGDHARLCPSGDLG